MRRSLTAILGCVALAVLGCSDPQQGPDDPVPAPSVALRWDPTALPLPDGPGGRVAVREAVACEGTWWLVGAIFRGEETVPAGWRSDDDGQTWTPLRFAPRSYWGARAVLSSVACNGDRVVMLGARSGGAHGNPRVTTWYQATDGSFVDAAAPFPLFGGVEAVSVERVAAGPTSWLIAGNRTAGAAVWLSADEQVFELVDDDPALIRDEQVDTLAIAPVHDGEGWTLVGSGQVEGRVDRVPMAWASADGRTWTRQEVPAGEGYADLQRAGRTDEGLLAVGLRDDRFGTWRRTDGAWAAGESFGRLSPDGQAFAGASSLATSGGRALATVSDGSSYSLWGWLGAEEWQEIQVPASPAAAGGHVLTVGATDDTVLLVVDDGETGRVWRAAWPQ